MRRNKVAVLILAGILILLFGLFSCSPSSAPAEETTVATEKAKPAEETTTTEAKEPVTLTYWQAEDPERDGFNKTISNMVTEYEAANPNVKISIQGFPYEDYSTKVISGLAAGAGPDIFMTEDQEYAYYIANNMLDLMPDEVEARYLESGVFKNAEEGLRMKS